MRIVFIGTGDIGIPVLQWLIEHHEVVGVVAQPDKPVGRKQELTPPATKRLAVERGVPVFQPKRLRNPESVAEVAALRPELIVVIAYGQILPKAVLDIPTLACLNLHASLLPKYRGAAPIQASIEAGDAETGIAAMWMDEGLDTGDVLLMHRIAIHPQETGGTLHDRLADAAPACLAEAIARLAAGDAPRIPQDSALATYAPKLSRESGVIEWSASSVEIDRRIRAMNPWPAASTGLSDPAGGAPRKLKVFAALVRPEAHGNPGTVLAADSAGILVATGEGALLLTDIQLEGKRRMPVSEFLRGNPIAAGTQLRSASLGAQEAGEK